MLEAFDPVFLKPTFKNRVAFLLGMKISYTPKRIVFEKKLNALDHLTLDFAAVLERLKIKYVVVSGYVSILFGRSRSSEDVDLIMEKVPPERFQELWEALSERFVCINAGDSNEAYKDYLTTGHAVRFSKPGVLVPNIELKFPKIPPEFEALRERKEVLVNKKRLFVSPLELQIAFKLYLGSEKDIEDAKHLYRLFKGKLDRRLLDDHNQKLNITHVFRRYLE